MKLQTGEMLGMTLSCQGEVSDLGFTWSLGFRV